MHVLLFVGWFAIALALRWGWRPQGGTWNHRWNRALAIFCLPALLLLSASVAVLWMGHHGDMMGLPVSPWGCWFGRFFLSASAGVGLASLAKALWFQWQVRRLPRVPLPNGEWGRCLDSHCPFAAQVGGLRSHIIVSRGWLETLTEPEQQAILRHEQAHAHYRDPICFWGLGIIRQLTRWLPATNSLWQELLLLREIRADRRAMEDTDPLLLAELLVKLVRSEGEALDPPPLAVGFCDHESVDRLEQRIEALVNPVSLPSGDSSGGKLGWIALTLMPFGLVLLHS
jgi:Zn-dependent protease with chaperone function